MASPVPSSEADERELTPVITDAVSNQSIAAKDTEPESEPDGEKEPGVPTLWAKSLHCLAASVGDEDGTKLGMYLNIPTTKLISIRHRGLEEGLSEREVVANILVFWKLMRQTVSEKTLIADLRDALLNIDREDLADAVSSHYENEQDMTVDSLPGVRRRISVKEQQQQQQQEQSSSAVVESEVSIN